MEKHEIGIKIHLFNNIYLGSDKYEYHLYTLKNDKKGNEIKSYLCHYSRLESLIDGMMDFYLKNFSNADTIEKLKKDINEVSEIIKKIKI